MLSLRAREAGVAISIRLAWPQYYRLFLAFRDCRALRARNDDAHNYPVIGICNDAARNYHVLRIHINDARDYHVLRTRNNSESGVQFALTMTPGLLREYL